ncbi:phage tail tape measure protein [Clostridium sp.]|uniref:phage tail tape measure protein n=1 Tax=Clostridium sp. TaxID=1506 RepID=UPI001A4776AC|nr:phage tail tape measure protein [Clostridium sp.]MBK5234050.1 phage tail tape measure protein [Clostridium sp.]
MNNVGSAMAHLDLDTTRFTAGLGKAAAALKVFKNSSETSMSKMAAASALAKSTGTALTLGVTVPLLGMAAAAVATATSFETSLAKVSTIADTTVMSMDDISQGILDMSADVHASGNDLNEGLYQVISATGDTANALGYLKISAKLAKGGFTDVTSAVDGATSVMNAYGFEGEDAFQKVADMMIMTQNLGKTTVDELASSLSNVIPTASAMGVGFDQVSAAMATMTAQGTPTSKATTGLNQLLAELGKQGTQAAVSLEAALKNTEYEGKGFQQLIAEGMNLNEVLMLMDASTEGTDKTLLDLFSSIDSGKAALQLTGNGTEKFISALDGMQTASGATEEAFEKMSATSGTSFTDLKISLTNLAITFGELILPYVKQFVEWLTELATKVKGMDEKTKKMIITIGAVLAVLGPVLLITSKLISAFMNVRKAIAIFTKFGGVLKVLKIAFAALTSVPGLIIIGIIALVLAFKYLWDNCEAFRNFWINLIDSLVTTFSALPGQILGAVEAIKNFFMVSIPEALDSFKEKFFELVASVKNKFIEFKTNFIDLIVSLIDGIKNIVNNFPYYVGFILGYILELILELPGKIWTILCDVFSRIYEFGVSAKDAAIDIGTSFVDNIVTFFTELPGKVWNLLCKVVSAVFDFGADLKVAATNTITAFIDEVVRIATELPGKFAKFLDELPKKVDDIKSDLYDAGKNIINGLWDGLKSAWEDVSNWFGGVMSSVGDFVSGIKDGMDSAKDKTSGFSDGSHADGLNYVPYDGYRATLHKGEAVITAKENERGYSSNSGLNVTINSPKALDERVANKIFKKTLIQIDKGLLGG